jgi:branched chain amino acid efflux pump
VSDAWILVAVVGLATVAIKGAGPVLLGSRELPTRIASPLSVLAPALLAALVVVNTVGGDRRIVLDARLVGVLAALVALRLRAPLLAVVAVAAATTAVTRALS